MPLADALDHRGRFVVKHVFVWQAVRVAWPLHDRCDGARPHFPFGSNPAAHATGRMRPRAAVQSAPSARAISALPSHPSRPEKWPIGRHREGVSGFGAVPTGRPAFRASAASRSLDRQVPAHRSRRKCPDRRRWRHNTAPLGSHELGGGAVNVPRGVSSAKRSGTTRRLVNLAPMAADRSGSQGLLLRSGISISWAWPSARLRAWPVGPRWRDHCFALHQRP